MNKKVCIRIKGLHAMIGSNEDAIEVINIGSYYKRNGKHYVKYEESIDESENTNSNILKISESEVELIAKGIAGTHMVFTNGQKNLSYYSTPFGGMNMGIDTYSLNITEAEDKISADIRYGLEINLDHVSNCKVHIDIESVVS